METRTVSHVLRKKGGGKLVIIASRRTDYPAFYTEDLLEGLEQGRFECHPPRQSPFILSFTPDEIHSVGLWSQNFHNWLRNRERVEALPFAFWYRFTILPDGELKINVPRVEEQLRQLAELVELSATPEAVLVYVDPVIPYRRTGGTGWEVNYSVDALSAILGKCHSLGIDNVTMSLVDEYRKIAKRAADNGLELKFDHFETDAGRARTATIMHDFRKVADEYGMTLRSCCEPWLCREGLVEKGGCIDGALLNRLFGPGASTKPDPGQRDGCGCTHSFDIGSYSMKCGHGCIQCYAMR